MKDKYLRLAAEYDNFKKRSVKERTDLWQRAQADLIQRLVDALDDLARFAHVDPVQTDAKTIHDGVDMVERKMWKVLEAAGVTRVDQVGVPFDPHVHEAVTTRPADHAAKDDTVVAVLQPGYRMGGAMERSRAPVRGTGAVAGRHQAPMPTSMCPIWARSVGWATSSRRSSVGAAPACRSTTRRRSRRRSRSRSGSPRWVGKCPRRS